MNKDITEALQDKLGNAQDNLYRAKCATRFHDPSQLWGQSGQTLGEIISGYQAGVDRWEAAIKQMEELT